MRTQKWIIWLWAFSLIIATTGVSLHQIYCFCVGERTVSIFHEPQDACLKENTCVASRSSLTDFNCCKKKASAVPLCDKQNKSSDDDDDCGRKTTQFFKLKTELQSTEIEQLNHVKSACAVEISAICTPSIISIPDDSRVLTISSTDLPPPMSGRHICLRYGVIRC